MNQTKIGIKLLIVEDDPSIAQVLLSVMSDEGYQISTASSAEKALLLLEKENFNIILLDIVLPKMNGLEFLSLIRQEKNMSELPIVVLTAFDHKEDRLKALEAGANDFIVKPVEHFSLIYKLRNLTQLQQADQQLKNQVNDLKNLQRTLRDIFDNTPVLMMLVDKDCNIIEINRTGLERIPISSKQAKSIKDLFRCQNSDANDKRCGCFKSCEECPMRKLINETLENGRNVYKREMQFEVLHPQGARKLTLLASSTCLSDGRLLVSIDDITERKLIEAQTKQHNQELQALNAAKDQLFSIIAHDLKNPFNVIQSFSELLQRKYHQYTDEKRLKFLAYINETANNTYKLLDNLLTWARSQTGRLVYKPKEFDLSVSVEEIIVLHKHHATKKDIAINNKLTKQCLVYADKNMTDTVIRNLLSNAVKFTPQGGSITINAKQKSTDLQSFVEVCVEDSGIGMPASKQKNLFKTGLHNSSLGTDNEKGTGLGLLLCKEFVEKNGGSIYFESREGKGSRFFFTLLQKQAKKATQTQST